MSVNEPMDTGEPVAPLPAATPPPAPAAIDPETRNYIVTALRPTVVTDAVVGNFRNTADLDIILARVDRLDYYLLTADGLKAYREIPVFGRIATLNVYRRPKEKLDSILVLTAKYHMAIISFDKNGSPHTRASGSVADRVGRPAETGFITCVHPSGLIALRLYDGFLKLVQWSPSSDPKDEWNTFSVRFEYNNVTDVDFMDDSDPTIVYFHEDQHGKYMRICKIDVESKRMLLPHESAEGIEQTATLLIPVRQPFGGVIIVGQESITYQKGQFRKPVMTPQFYQPHYTCYSRVGADGDRFLLGDSSGRLLMLMLIADQNNSVVDLQVVGSYKVKNEVENLGNDISIPECLVYLDNSVVFLGSRFGDSQLLRLNSEPRNDDTFVEVLDTITNIGPIRDFIIITKDNQPQMITCSGCYKNGSLRVIRNGIGIESLASIDLPAVTSIFTLRVNSQWDNCMILSFMSSTAIVAINGEMFSGTELKGFVTTQRTLWTGNAGPNRIVQVTASGISLFSADGAFATKWLTTFGQRLTVAAANLSAGQLVVGTSDNRIYYFVIVNDEIHFISEYTCAEEISCIDISPIVPGTVANFFAAAFWKTHEVMLFELQSKIQLLHSKSLGTVLPRSVLIIKLSVDLYLMVATGDGTLHYIRLNETTGRFLETKKLSLGTMPAELKKFTWKNSTNVFFCCDRPVVISSVNNRLAFYSVNAKAALKVTTFDTETFRDCLMMWDGETIVVGTIDHIQKLHIRTVPLGQTVSRIAHQPETKTVAILTSRFEDVLKDGRRRTDPSVSQSSASKIHSASAPRSTAEPPNALTALALAGNTPSSSTDADCVEKTVEVHSVCVLDANTFECLHVCDLGEDEFGLSLCSVKMGSDGTPYYVVGTALISAEEKEPKVGRILVLYVPSASGTDVGRLRIVHEKETRGAVYAVMTLANKLICTINSSVRLFEWTPDRELRLECSHFNHVAALYLKTKGDLALVGDLMRSLCLVSYKADDSSFVEIARDYSMQWVSACEIINSDTFIGAENNYNIFCCKKNNEAPASEEERTILRPSGSFYLGQMINVFRRGTIITNEPEKSVQHLAESNAITYGTSDGGLGVIVQIPSKLFTFLSELQKNASAETKNAIGVKHTDYRNFCVDRMVDEWSNFIDGDLIESLSEMPTDCLDRVLKNVLMPSLNINDLWTADETMTAATKEDVLKFVEDISRIH